MNGKEDCFYPRSQLTELSFRDLELLRDGKKNKTGSRKKDAFQLIVNTHKVIREQFLCVQLKKIPFIV